MRALQHLLLACLLLATCGQWWAVGDGDPGAGAGGAATDGALPVDSLSLPPGFSASVYSAEVPAARELELGLADSNTTVVYASSTRAGVITALVQRGHEVTACELIQGQRNPNGIAYRNGSLYVATVTEIARWDAVDAAALACDPGLLTREKISDLPNHGGHTNRALAISPQDNKLYVSLGSSDNAGVCGGEPPTCSIQRLNADGSGMETFAANMRNAAGLAFQPSTGRLWFANMGRDMLGNDIPDDTLVVAGQPGLDYQFPYCSWVGTGDPEQRDPGPGSTFADPDTPPPDQPPPAGNDSYFGWCVENAAPVALGPHVAPIGLTFFEGPAAGEEGAPPSAFPAQYRGGVFVAEHGSWNRDQKIGYRVAFVGLTEDGRAANHTVFASGWLRPDDQSVWGRPVDVLFLPDGSLLVSDDYANAVYRVAYSALH